MNTGIDEKSLSENQVIEILKGICRRKGVSVEINSTTKIFDQKILDSVTFVEFVTALEVDLGVNVPDHKMSTQYFVTPECIARNFSSR